MFDKDYERKGIEKKFFELSQKIVESDLGLKLYDMDYSPSQKLLRVFIHQKEKLSASIDDCVLVDKSFDPHVENSDFFPDGFKLEVSSPGVFRVLKTEEHFKMAINQIIKLKVSGSVKVINNKDNSLNKEDLVYRGVLRGLLQDVSESGIMVIEETKKKIFEIPYEMIKNAHLDPNWEDLLTSSEVNL